MGISYNSSTKCEYNMGKFDCILLVKMSQFIYVWVCLLSHSSPGICKGMNNKLGLCQLNTEGLSLKV